ncbi:MAG TPA: Uma2 family endonuclease [Planctomycetaceae bacterium]
MASVTLPDRHFTQPPYPVRQFTVDEYHRLIENGILGENDRVELLEGWIVPKMTHNPPHDGTIQIISKRLRRWTPQKWDIRIQSAVTMTDSEPEPDLAIVRDLEREYLARHPGPPDIGLLIEVAESSLIQDREDKARIYARAGIPTYWIINLVDARIEVFNDPTGSEGQPAYRGRAIYTHEELVTLVLDGTEIARIPAKDLLP